jgi:GNAT superfamily N-acetyltransferase
MSYVYELVEKWIERLDRGPVDLRSDLDRFPELRDAVVPVGFSIAVEEGSYLMAEGDAIRGELLGRVIPSGMATSATPPETGAIGLAFDSEASYAEIETLDTAAQAQRRGLGRLTMAGIADLADRLGIGALTLEAGKIGRYAWARCGFNFMYPEEARPRVLAAAAAFAESLGIACDLAEIRQPWQLAALSGQVTAAQVERAGGPRALPGRIPWSLGQALLLGPPENANAWFGRLDPRSENPDRVRLDAYARGSDYRS